MKSTTAYDTIKAFVEKEQDRQFRVLSPREQQEQILAKYDAVQKRKASLDKKRAEVRSRVAVITAENKEDVQELKNKKAHLRKSGASQAEIDALTEQQGNIRENIIEHSREQEKVEAEYKAVLAEERVLDRKYSQAERIEAQQQQVRKFVASPGKANPRRKGIGNLFPNAKGEPGSLLAVVIALIGMNTLIVPVNGSYTRFQLFLQVLLGNTTLAGTNEAGLPSSQGTPATLAPTTPVTAKEKPFNLLTPGSMEQKQAVKQTNQINQGVNQTAGNINNAVQTIEQDARQLYNTLLGAI